MKAGAGIGTGADNKKPRRSGLFIGQRRNGALNVKR
jgi:hypothetical protein